MAPGVWLVGQPRVIHSSHQLKVFISGKLVPIHLLPCAQFYFAFSRRAFHSNRSGTTRASSTCSTLRHAGRHRLPGYAARCRSTPGDHRRSRTVPTKRRPTNTFKERCLPSTPWTRPLHCWPAARSGPHRNATLDCYVSEQKYRLCFPLHIHFTIRIQRFVCFLCPPSIKFCWRF